MSEDVGARNVEIVKAIHQAFKQAGAEAVRAALIEARTFDQVAEHLPEYSNLAPVIDPDITIDARGRGGPLGHGGVWRGRDEWVEFWRDWLEPWEDFDYETSGYEAVGDHVVMDISIRGRGRGSGAPVEWTQTQIWTFRDGRVVALRPGYETRADAIRTAEAEGG